MKRAIALGAAVAMVLLLLTLPDGPFDEHRVAGAGQWFAGIAGFLVLAWALQEPERQRKHSLNVDRLERDRDLEQEADRRLAVARSVILFDGRLDLLDVPWLLGPGVVKQLAGRVGNFTAWPVRSVRLVIDWTEQNADLQRAEIKQEDPATATRSDGKLYEFTLADALEPGGARDIEEHGAPINFVLAEDRNVTDDVAHLRLLFIDVHGDEWQGWFGPAGEDAYLSLKESKSGFWTDGLRQRIPIPTAEALRSSASAVQRRQPDR